MLHLFRFNDSDSELSKSLKSSQDAEILPVGRTTFASLRFFFPNAVDREMCGME